MDLQSTVSTIKAYELDIEQANEQIKTTNEMIAEELESMAEYQAVEKAQETLKAAKAALKQALLGNAEYNNLLEEKGQLQDKVKDAKEILSDYVVAYFAETKERQLQVETNGDARELIVTGKLGKKQKYQTSIFNASDNKVEKLADDIKKLSPAGQAVIDILLDKS